MFIALFARVRVRFAKSLRSIELGVTRGNALVLLVFFDVLTMRPRHASRPQGDVQISSGANWGDEVPLQMSGNATQYKRARRVE